MCALFLWGQCEILHLAQLTSYFLILDLDSSVCVPFLWGTAFPNCCSFLQNSPKSLWLTAPGICVILLIAPKRLDALILLDQWSIFNPQWISSLFLSSPITTWHLYRVLPCAEYDWKSTGQTFCAQELHQELVILIISYIVCANAKIQEIKGNTQICSMDWFTHWLHPF